MQKFLKARNEIFQSKKFSSKIRCAKEFQKYRVEKHEGKLEKEGVVGRNKGVRPHWKGVLVPVIS